MIKSVKEKDGSFLYHLICFAAILSLLILAEKLVQDKGGMLITALSVQSSHCFATYLKTDGYAF